MPVKCNEENIHLQRQHLSQNPDVPLSSPQLSPCCALLPSKDQKSSCPSNYKRKTKERKKIKLVKLHSLQHEKELIVEKVDISMQKHLIFFSLKVETH